MSNLPIKRISIHATDTLEGRELSMATLAMWHKERGFGTVGYHYVIHLDGRVERSPRPVTTRPCAVKGYNQGMIAIAYVGGAITKTGTTGKLLRDSKGVVRLFSHDTRTPAQKAALGPLVKRLAAAYHIPEHEIRGHRDWDYVDKNHDGKAEPGEWLKECPCFEVSAERAGWLK